MPNTRSQRSGAARKRARSISAAPKARKTQKTRAVQDDDEDLIDETGSGSDSEFDDDNGDVMDVEEHEEGDEGGADDADDAEDAYNGDDDNDEDDDGDDDDGSDDADANHSRDARDADDADPFRDSNESDDSDNSDHISGDGDANSIVGSMDSGSDFEERRRIREKIKLRKDLYTRELNSGFNALRGEELKKIAMDGPARLARAANKMKKWFKRHPKHDQKQLANLLPKAEDYYEKGWTDEMERELQRRMKKKPEIAYIKAIKNPKSTSAFMAMWKKLCRSLRVFPTEIISPHHNLAYGATPDIEVKRKGGNTISFPNPIWTKRFCDELVVLTIGGPWMGNMNLLACIIQYAKACQCNDRRRISWRHGTDHRFMDSLQKRLARTDGEKSIPELHRDSREEMRRMNRSLPPWSALLQHIEKKFYKRNQQPLVDGHHESHPYRVETGDLRDLVKVMRSVRSGPHQIWPSLRDSTRLVSTSRGMDNPKRIKDVMELYLGHLIAYERSRMVEDMRSPSPFANVSDSGLEGGRKSAPARDSPLGMHSGGDESDRDLEGGRKSPPARDSPLGMDFGGGIDRDDTPQDEDNNSAEQGPDNGFNNNEPEHPSDHTPSPRQATTEDADKPVANSDRRLDHGSDGHGITQDAPKRETHMAKHRRERRKVPKVPVYGYKDLVKEDISFGPGRHQAECGESSEPVSAGFKLGTKISKAVIQPLGRLEMEFDIPSETRELLLTGMNEKEATQMMLGQGRNVLMDMTFPQVFSDPNRKWTGYE